MICDAWQGRCRILPWRRIETHSCRYPRHFTFYVADPIGSINAEFFPVIDEEVRHGALWLLKRS